MSDRLVTPTPELYALADSSRDDSPFRADEPYRRALSGISARLARHGARRPRPGPRPAPGGRTLPPYDSPDELRADLDVVDASLRSHGAGALADDRLLRLREAVEVFGFHLCGLDMRQNSAVHEEVVAELLAWAGVCDDYTALDEAARVALLAGRADDAPSAGAARRRALRHRPRRARRPDRRRRAGGAARARGPSRTT